MNCASEDIYQWLFIREHITDTSPLCLLPLLDGSSLSGQNPGIKIPRHEPSHCWVTQGLDMAASELVEVQAWLS